MKMNKKLLMIGATLAMSLQLDSIAMAANVDGTADVEIVQPLSITQAAGSGLNFGKIASGPAAGVVRVSSTGVLSKVSGPVEVQIVDSTSASTGVFDITGENGQTILVTVPASTLLTANGGSGGADMTVTLSSDAATTTTLDATTGAATLTVFGDLGVGVNQATDTYSGTYNVTVFYN